MEVGHRTLRRMVDLRDQCILRIVGADDPEAAFAVMGRLSEVAFAVGRGEYGVNFVSEVMRTPDGPLVLMDAESLSRAQLGQVLDRLVDIAEEVGLNTGTLEVPKAGRLVEDLARVRAGLVGAVMPPPDPTTARSRETIPEEWLDVAAGWLRGAAFEPLVVEVIAVEARIGWDDLDEYLRASLHSGFRVSCGSVATGLRTVAANTKVHTRLSFLAVNQSWSLSEQTREANDLLAHVRRCAPLAASGYVATTPRPRTFGLGELDVPSIELPSDGFQAVCDMSDIQLIDAFWYQFLGPGHLERTGPLSGAHDLGDGKAELTLGDFPGWLEPERAAQLREAGRTMLAPCFLSVPEVRALRRQRRGLEA
jgi:hypothetical protein